MNHSENMKALPEEMINEIADQLDCGFRCYLHEETNKLIAVPDTDRFFDMDISVWESELEELENNFSAYREIKGMESRDSFSVMEEFTETLSVTNKLKAMLWQSLKGAKPFKNFMYIIHDSGEYRQHWFDFKNEKLKEWVKNQLDIEEG